MSEVGFIHASERDDTNNKHFREKVFSMHGSVGSGGNDILKATKRLEGQEWKGRGRGRLERSVVGRSFMLLLPLVLVDSFFFPPSVFATRHTYAHWDGRRVFSWGF